MSIRIVESTDAAEVDALLRPRRDDRRRAAASGRAHRRGRPRRWRRGGRGSTPAKFDGLAGAFEIPRAEWQRAAAAGASGRAQGAADGGAAHRASSPGRSCRRAARVRVAPGVSVEQQVRPLERVGCYVPGGRYPLPSSLLMTAVPARVAGVREIIVVCPRPEPVVMAAASTAGVTRLFRLGGAHAIAALAFGTATVPRVDRIVGPGNKYVALRQELRVGEVGIDMHAGPSEILILSSRGQAGVARRRSDRAGRARSRRARRCSSRGTGTLAERRGARSRCAAARRGAGWRVARGARRHHRRRRSQRSHRAGQPHGARASGRRRRADRARRAACAGAIFIGEHTAQVAGDYAIGSNHVLPTGGAARVRGGLSAADFVRVVVGAARDQEPGLRALAPTVRALALAEGLTAHAQSIAVRAAMTGVVSARASRRRATVCGCT